MLATLWIGIALTIALNSALTVWAIRAELALEVKQDDPAVVKARWLRMVRNGKGME